MTMQNKTHSRAVFVVDDDVAVQRGVAALLTAADYAVTIFDSGNDFLSRLGDLDIENAAALVDVCMPGIQGLELQERLNAQGVELPIIVMTAHGDVPMAVRAMQNGAIDFLEKPFTVDEVITALDRALSMARPVPKLVSSASPALRDKFESLTPRETDVFQAIVDGGTNKGIGRSLELSPRTVEVHRHNVMLKMDAGSLAELVRMAVALDI